MKNENKKYTIDDEYYYNLIRKNIKQIRLENNLTQKELANMIDISREYVSDIESDTRNKHVTISLLGRIAEVLNVEIVDFFK